MKISGQLSPGIILVKQSSRLSWKYHHRSTETWKIVKDEVGIVRSYDHNEYEVVNFKKRGKTEIAQTQGMSILLNFGNIQIHQVPRMMVIL